MSLVAPTFNPKALTLEMKSKVKSPPLLLSRNIEAGGTYIPLESFDIVRLPENTTLPIVRLEKLPSDWDSKSITVPPASEGSAEVVIGEPYAMVEIAESIKAKIIFFNSNSFLQMNFGFLCNKIAKIYVIDIVE